MIKILFTFFVCLLNILSNHILLTRKKTIMYSLFAFVLNTLFVFGTGLLAVKNIRNPVIVEYTASFFGFLYIAYIDLVFSESISKKIFTMFSIWIFSLIAYFIANQAAAVFAGIVDAKYIQYIIYVLRVGIQIIILLAAYFWLSKPYKKVISLVPDKIINFMSLYPIIAFLLLKASTTSRLDNSFNSIYNTILLIVFIILGYMIVFAGISASSKVELQHYMANYDSLTGIANRCSIMNQLDRIMEISSRSKEKFALFVFDLDGFKSINDKYGHLIGDIALKHVVQAVQKVLRNTDFIGRFGGDEFLIIRQFIRDERDVEALADRIFKELKTPLLIDDNKIQINLSIGISIFPDYASNMEVLINQADSAMYEAKKREGCAFSIFDLSLVP